MDRRKALILLGSTLGAASLGYVALRGKDSDEAPSYRDAFLKPEMQQAWLDSLAGRAYVEKKVASPSDLRILQEELGYVPPNGAFAGTIPSDAKKRGRGSPSTLYVFGESFNPEFARLLGRGLEQVVTNVVENHELVHGDHNFGGIPGYDLERFLNPDGSLDHALFTAVSEVIAHGEEFQGLSSANKGFAKYYRESLQGQVAPHLVNAIKKAPDREFADKVRNEVWF